MDLDDLRHAADRARRWTTERDHLIRAARDAGHTWPDIATAAGLSRQGVINIVRRTSTGH